MYNQLNFTQSGGLWLTQDSLASLQGGIANVLDSIAKLVGDKAVVNGVVVDGAGTSVSDGFISFNGEILPFVGGSKTNHIDIETIISDEQFDDGTLKPFQTVKRLKMVSLATSTSFLFTDLIYPGTFRNVWQKGDVKEIDCDMAYYAANFDSATGLGINERVGWALCDGRNGTKNRKGRVSVMIDETQTEFENFTIASGEKEHTLLVAEVPSLTISIPRVAYSGIGGFANKFVGTANTPDAGAQSISTNGGGGAHNNLQPYIVSLFIQKL